MTDVANLSLYVPGHNDWFRKDHVTHTKPMRFRFKKIPEFLGSLFSLGFEAGMCHCDAAAGESLLKMKPIQKKVEPEGEERLGPPLMSHKP